MSKWEERADSVVSSIAGIIIARTPPENTIDGRLPSDIVV